MAKTKSTQQAKPAADGQSPGQLLTALDRADAKEWLAEQIEQAKARVAEAQAELKSLMTLERIRAIRAGELKRKTPARPKRRGGPATPAVRLLDYLNQIGPATTAMLSVGLKLDDQQIVSELLKLEKAHAVRRTDCAGRLDL